MSGFFEGACQSQATLFPDRLDDYVNEENPIRVIDAFVDSLELSNLGFKTVPADTGCPAYHLSTDAQVVCLRIAKSYDAGALFEVSNHIEKSPVGL